MKTQCKPKAAAEAVCNIDKPNDCYSLHCIFLSHCVRDSHRLQMENKYLFPYSDSVARRIFYRLLQIWNFKMCRIDIIIWKIVSQKNPHRLHNASESYAPFIESPLYRPIVLIEPSQEKLVQCDKRLRMRLSESESFSSLRCAAMPADAAALLSM